MKINFTLIFLTIFYPFQLECILIKKQLESSYKLDWWQSEVIYQIYPRSFKDYSGDGTGDINGVYEKLSYIKSLGVGAVWFSPMYTSPMVDFGYDISDFKDIDPIFGTMGDFERLLDKAHKLGLKVLLDLVPNHTSDQHWWFKKSVQKINPYTDYYIWRDARFTHDTRVPPNNWLSCFGKSAWTWNSERGQYYLHQFAPEQPDLNYRNDLVHREMIDIMKFWLDMGVDGFRIDSINHIYEDAAFIDEPLSEWRGIPNDDYVFLIHMYTKNQKEDYEIALEWRKIVDQYSTHNSTKIIMVEAIEGTKYVMDFYRYKNQESAHFPFNFLMIWRVHRNSNALDIRYMIQDWYSSMPNGSWANWVLGNHDQPRVASRLNQYLLDAMHMLQMLLPGTAIVYNGDELGMEDTFIRWEQVKDPSGLNAGRERYMHKTRDPERTPFQWNDYDNAGFTRNFTAWLPVNPNYWEVNVKNENYSRKVTHLKIFKKLIQLRKKIVFQKGDLNVYILSEWVFAMTRSYPGSPTYIVIINMNNEITRSNLEIFRPSLPDVLNVVIGSINANYKPGNVVRTNDIKLRPYASLVLKAYEEEEWQLL